MGTGRGQAEAARRTVAARAGARDFACGIELDTAASLHEAADGDERGQGPSMDTARALWGAHDPPAGLVYRQEGLLEQLERVRLPAPEHAYCPGGAVELDLSGVGQSGEVPGIKAAQVPPDGELRRAELIGRLVQFIDYAVENGVLEGADALDTFIGRHVIQKHAYIAQELGMDIGYRFEFLKHGAYSPAMAVDIYERDLAVMGPVAFDPEPRESRAFVDLVRGRGPKWLQVATFAMRDRGTLGACEAFINDRYRHLEYDHGLVKGVFAEVALRMEWLEGGAA